MTKQISSNTIWTSANVVTMIRILFVPVFVVALISPWPSWIDSSGGLDWIKPWVALVIFVILSVTDSLDGYLARSKNQITNFGKFMDPLADKILVFAALIALVELSVLPSWVVLIILMREFIIAGIRMLAAAKGMVIAASWYGKAKTVAQLIAIILFILKESLSSSGAQDIANPLYIAAWVVMIIALILTIVSMLDYIYKAKDVFNDEDNASGSAADLVQLAKSNNLKIGSAESLTAGLVAAKIGSIPGASSVFAGSIVSYMYSVKENLLGVDKNILDTKGAVNEEVAKKMATSAVKKLGCDYCVSTTGIAGPSKDEFDTPVGTVYIACANSNSCEVAKFNFKGNRQEIRNAAADKAVELLFSFIK